MKFFTFALLALATVASAKKLELALDGQLSSYTNVLAKQIAPLLLQRQSLLNYRTVPLAYNAASRVVAQPQIYTVAAPVQTAAVQVAAPQVQYVQAAPAVQYVQAQATGPIPAAVQSQRSVQFIDVPSRGVVAAPQSIVIGPSIQPLDLEFQSQSSPVSTKQIHIPGTPNPPQFSSHQDEPDLLKQEIVKPIVHEVTEAIQPFRKITQEVRPVQETINQLITRGQEVQKIQAVVQQAVQAVAQPVQTIAVQAVQPVAVQSFAQPSFANVAVAAPAVTETVVAEAPAIETIAVERAPVAASTVEVIEEPVISTVAAAPALTESIQTGYQTVTLPVTAAITRY